MFDTSLPVAELPIMSPGQNDDYFKEHYTEWREQVFNKLVELGYPAEMWSPDAMWVSGFVRYWKATGYPRNPAQTNAVMDKRAYDGPVMPASAIKMHNESFPHVTNALFCITKGEDWWPYEKAFLCNNAESYMRFVLYTLAIMNPSIMDKPVEKKRGRPRDDAAHAAKADKSQRYQEWLLLCEAHRAELALAESAYREAWAASEKLRIEFNMLKARGAPKWIP